MRVVFMGTPEFAVASLECLIQNKIDVVAVVTAPDRPSGRGQHLSMPAVKIAALKHNLKVLQPPNLKDDGFLLELSSLKADLQVVVAFRMLPEVVWNMPPMGTINLHASLLPKYRGAAPINWAIINGETETGVTTFKLQHQVDTGNIFLSEKVPIGEETNAGELHDTLMHVGARLLLKTVNEINEHVTRHKELHFTQQNEQEVSHAPKIFRDTCRINWGSEAKKIHDLIRGLSPYPGAFTTLRTTDATFSLKIYTTTFAKFDHQETNGSLSTDNKNFIRVFCPGGVIEIKELQLEGKKRLTTTDFLRGFTFGPMDNLL